MAIADPRIHIICGICGSKNYMSFKVDRDANIHNEGEDNEYTTNMVYIHCDNCGSLTALDELMPEKET